MNYNNTLAIVVPCYNEEEAFPFTVKSLTEVLGNLIRLEKVNKNSYLLFVDDGSKDKTWQLIEAEADRNSLVRGLKLSGNVGHQNALLAGLLTANEDSDITVSIDADLQDDISAIEKMVDAYHGGADIVYGVRSDRKSDSMFKRTTAQGFYKLMSAMGVKTVYNHADFRLMSHRAIEALAQYKERNLFLRGIVPLIGFKTEAVYYERAKRVAGQSKYPLKKMLKFAFDGITSFSIKPITLITTVGILIIICSIAALIYTLISYFTGNTEPGWASLIISIWFLGGVQLAAIGLVGQYVGKIYVESKERPRYNIEKYKKHTDQDK
jgi:glycosyltransferase involved in cell wall biosynthesis